MPLKLVMIPLWTTTNSAGNQHIDIHVINDPNARTNNMVATPHTHAHTHYTHTHMHKHITHAHAIDDPHIKPF